MAAVTTEERPPEEEPPVVADWIPVSHWDEKARAFIPDPDDLPTAIISDIEAIQRVIARIRGGPMNEEMSRARHVLDVALAGRQLELAGIILRLHGGDRDH